MNNDYLFLATVIFLVISIFFNVVIFLSFRKIRRQSEEFFSGKNGKDLEEVIERQKELIRKNENGVKELFDAYEKIYKMTHKGIHKVGVIRYNPFGDMGGNQSFVVALLDGDNSGVVISSLHTREGTRLFSKPIMKGKCFDYPLTDEEAKAIKNASVSKKSLKV